MNNDAPAGSTGGNGNRAERDAVKALLQAGLEEEAAIRPGGDRPTHQMLRTPAFLLAATSASFSVDDLWPVAANATSDAAAISAVLNSSMVIPAGSVDRSPRYRLTNSARREVLEAWAGADELLQQLSSGASQDPETHFLRRIALDPSGFLGSIEMGNISSVRAAARACEMMSALRPEMGSELDELRRRLSVEEIFAPLKMLINKQSAVGEGDGPDSFVARHAELLTLYTHVGVRPPASWGESLRILARRAVEVFRGAPRGALVVHAIGGMGKSALIAKFTLEHLKAGADWIPLAYLDFDRAALAAGEPPAILMEIVRQLQLQLPNSTGKERTPVPQEPGDQETLQALFVDLQSECRRSANELRGVYAARFREIVSRIAGDRPFLLVLDTLERVQLRGGSASQKLVGLLDQLGLFEATWNFRVVACSRMDFPELRALGSDPAPIPLLKLNQVESEEMAFANLRSLSRDRKLECTPFRRTGSRLI